MTEPLEKYTADESRMQIPCRVWLADEGRALLIDLAAIPERAMYVDVIAHSLATKARYNGHTPFPYYVATHSVLVSLLLPKDVAIWLEIEATLHDAAEVLVGDMIHPVKRECPEFKRIENMVDAQIRAFYGLPAIEHDLVKEADTKALWLEQRILQRKAYSPEALAILQPVEVEIAAALCAQEIRWRDSRVLFREHLSILMQEAMH